jgi:2-phosphosulfolactate phosphatase
MLRSVEEALELHQSGLGQFCIGEVGGRAPDAFDFGNHPSRSPRSGARGLPLLKKLKGAILIYYDPEAGECQIR